MTSPVLRSRKLPWNAPLLMLMKASLRATRPVGAIVRFGLVNLSGILRLLLPLSLLFFLTRSGSNLAAFSRIRPWSMRTSVSLLLPSYVFRYQQATDALSYPPRTDSRASSTPFNPAGLYAHSPSLDQIVSLRSHQEVMERFTVRFPTILGMTF